MLHGEISDRAAPRWLWQFEELVASPPATRQLRLRPKRTGRLRWWRDEFAQWEPHEFTLLRMTDAYYRLDMRIDLVTFLDVPAVATEAMAEYLDERSVPVGRVVRFAPDGLARSLVHMPDVAGVVHTLPNAQFKFGGKGHYVAAGSEGWSLL